MSGRSLSGCRWGDSFVVSGKLELPVSFVGGSIASDSFGINCCPAFNSSGCDWLGRIVGPVLSCFVAPWGSCPLSFVCLSTSLEMNCHCEKVHLLLMEGLTVSKKWSNWMWKCGKTNPVSNFNTRLIELACHGDGQRLIPSWAHLFHFGIAFPPCSWSCSAYTGQQKVWLGQSFGLMSVQQNHSKGELPSSLSAIVLRISFALRMA
jgi:hypothetical protein